MPPLMSLPPDVLQTLPWEESDLSSVVLTCRLFHQLFTPRLYDNFTAEADYLDLRYPGLDFPEFLFLRTIRNCPTLASFVQDLSLALVGLSYWDHEDFRRVARDLEIAADFHTVALPAGPSAQTPTEDMVLGKQESAIHQEGVGEPLSERHGSDRDAEGNMYSEEQFLEDFGCALLSKLPQLRRLTLMYDRMRLFDRFAHFAYLEEVNIDSARIPVRAAGNELFEDAVRLLGLPKIRKWSLSCAEVSESAIRCIPPQSSPVQEISISCPNIPARDFHYLMAIPKALKVFRWNLKAWTCYLMSEGTLPVHEQWMEAGREVDDSDPDSGNHHEDIVDSAESEGHTECQTLSPASMFSSLRHLQTSLEEISVEYAFIGSCSHADPGPSSLDDFTNLKKLSISPQILRGFHGCTDQETCATDNLERLDLWMQVDADEVADLVTHTLNVGISTLREIVLHSTIHLADELEIEDDSARKHRPMTTKRYYELRAECDSSKVALLSCCYEACLEELVQSAKGRVHSDQIPSDMAVDERAAAQSWQGMHPIAQNLMTLKALSRSNQSELPA